VTALLRLTIDTRRPSEATAATPRRAILKDSVGGARAFAWTAGGAEWIEVLDTATYRFAPGSQEVIGFAPQPADRDVVVDTYFGTVLPLLLQGAFELEALHGSGVLLSDGRVAGLAAESQTGKTTLAYALSRRGCELWADDAIVLDAKEPGLVLSVRLPFRIRLRRETAAHFGTGRHVVRDEMPEHLIFDLETAPRAPLGAVVVCERAASAPAVERVSAADALELTMRHAYRYQPLAEGRKRRMFETYLDLVTNVPVFLARFRRGLEDLDDLLVAIERALQQSRSRD